MRRVVQAVALARVLEEEPQQERPSRRAAPERDQRIAQLLASLQLPPAPLPELLPPASPPPSVPSEASSPSSRLSSPPTPRHSRTPRTSTC